MRLLESQHLARLPVRQRRLVFAEFARYRDIGTAAIQQFTGRHVSGDGVVDGVEDLVAEPVLLDRQMYDLAEVAGVDIAPGIAFSGWRIGQIAWKPVVLMRLDDVADPQRIDVDAVAHGKRPRRF